MKKVMTLLFLLSSAIAVGTPTINIADGPGNGPGGSFLITVVSEGWKGNPVGSTFYTFCIEKDEFISPPPSGPYDVVINTQAELGGVNTNSGDPLDPLTAYLYTAYIKGTLAGWTNSNADNDDLQNAIWYIEQEINSLPAGNATTWYNQAVAAGWTSIQNVRVMNLYKKGHAGESGYEKQDMLTIIPAPGALLLGSLGMGLVGWLRRRQAV